MQITLSRVVPLIAALPLLVSQAGATVIGVSIDTSPLSGQSGGIYFQFSPGLDALPASVSITDFLISPPGALNPSSPLNFSDGGAAGTLDADNLTIANTTALNDYGEALVFGGRITFDVILNFPSVPGGSSGSELDVQVTGADLLTPLLTSDPNGNIVEISYDQTNSLNVISTSTSAIVNEVPEPNYLAVLGVLSALLLPWHRRKRLKNLARRAAKGAADL